MGLEVHEPIDHMRAQVLHRWVQRHVEIDDGRVFEQFWLMTVKFSEE